MLNQLRPAIASLVLLSAITGVVYPLAVTGIAQVAFHDQANGSLVRDEQGNVRGSALIAQKFDGAQWFHSRPSAGDFATVSSSASNLAPGNPALAERIAKATAHQGGAASEIRDRSERIHHLGGDNLTRIGEGRAQGEQLLQLGGRLHTAVQAFRV